MSHRDHSEYGLNQWETTLLCNASHWLSPYPELSLHYLVCWWYFQTMVATLKISCLSYYSKPTKWIVSAMCEIIILNTLFQAHQSNRVCNALALLQCVASHPETRSAFLQGNIGPWRFEWNFRQVILKLILVIDDRSISCEISNR